MCRRTADATSTVTSLVEARELEEGGLAAITGAAR
jgi:hypothetical protein